MDDFLDDAPQGAVATIMPQQLPDVQDLSPDMQAAVMLQTSGLFPNTGSVAGVFTVVQFGKEVGLPPVQALNNVAIINGKLSMSGASMLALGYKHGVTAEFVKETDTECEIIFSREGFKPYTSRFTIEDAEKAQLGDRDKTTGKLKTSSVWYKYTRTMLKWRAVAQGMRNIAPDILAGVYTKDEIVNIGSALVAQNDTGDIADDAAECAQNDTPKEEAQVSDKITESQMKRLHALMNLKGLTVFREGFKLFLATFEDSGITSGGSAKDLNKDFTQSMLDEFDKYARTFYASEKSRDYLNDTFSRQERDGKAKIIAGMKTLVKGGESFPLQVTDQTSDAMIKDWFQLMLTAIANQEINRAAETGEKKGMTADEVKETLEELGMKPEVVDKAEAKKEEKKEQPKPTSGDLLEF